MEQPKTQIDKRFRKELREQKLPKAISLHGNPMLRAVAELLLKKHTQGIALKDDAAKVTLMSMEEFGSRLLAALMEEQDPPAAPRLLYSIPEAEIISYAKRHSIPVVAGERDDVRRMLDSIAKQQPQTYYSLARSAHRLSSAAELLRKGK